MRPLVTFSVIGLTPIFQCSACRASPLFTQQDLRLQCLPSSSSPPFGHHYGDTRSHGPFSRISASTRAYSTAASNNAFTFHLSASFSGKARRFNPRTDLFSFDPTRPAAPGKISLTGRPVSGQDAFFISKIGAGSNVAFGVADGVGGWSDSGIDSAHFSHGLCEYLIRTSTKTEESARRKLNPQQLLQQGYEATVADKSIYGGGSTACVATGRDDGTLEVANLGDSGFAQFRLNAVQHYSNPQTHAFNTPYQLSIIPPRILARSRLFGSEPLRDFPRDASVTQHQVRHGDVLVFATDGVWDNLTALDLLKIISRNMTAYGAWEVGEGNGVVASEDIESLTREARLEEQTRHSLQTLLATAIAGEAKLASVNAKRDGPFAKEVQKFYPHEEFHGGKMDDICVVVAVVVEKS
ncbi:hypothetical protein MMC12_002904 [Toensbergia leucococca]|nr:hypothetical protein [Toensbergia leucococca]